LAASVLSLLVGLAAPPSAADPIVHSRRTAAGVSLHVIDVDLTDPRVLVTPAVAAKGIGHADPFPDFIRRHNPVAAINGTYFSKKSLRPIGDIVVDGKLVHFGGMGTAIAFAADGVDFVRLPKSRHVDWSEHSAALAGGPLLVWDGFAKPDPGGEGFGDPSVFARAAPRSALAVTTDNHLLLATTARGTSLAKLAVALRDLGAVYAVNLDGGGSAGLWCQGRMIKQPGRRLTNILGVYLREEPAPRPALRAPRGLDWRGGRPPRPVMAFRAADLRLSVLLPRRWQGRSTMEVEADGPLPQGWSLSVWLDDEQVAVCERLPVEVPLDLSSLAGPKHRLWVGVLDGEGKAVGKSERIFQVGKAAWSG
jgi:hypothetical protein